MVGWSEVCYWHLGDGEGLGMLNHPVVGRVYIEELSEHIQTIQKSKSLSDKVTNIVRVVESQMDIPPTMLLEQ